MNLRLLLISEDPLLIASVHALEKRCRAATKSNAAIELPLRAVEVTFVSSLASALTSVKTACDAKRPFEIAVIDHRCSGLRVNSTVCELWNVAPQLTIIDCDAPPHGRSESSARTSVASPVPDLGRRFRLPAGVSEDQLLQLIDTQLDHAALQHRCVSLQAEVVRLGHRVDELEDQNQTLANQLARLRLKGSERMRNSTVTHRLGSSDVVAAIEERRAHGPAVRRVTVACEKPVSELGTGAGGARQVRSIASAGRRDVSDEINLKGRILVVDDVPGTRRLACFLLERAGADVVQADGGQAMLEVLSASLSSGESFAAVVMHMAMQELNGYECARQLRMQGYSGPIVAATTRSHPIDRQESLVAGCDELLTIPFDRNQFIRTMGRLLLPEPATT